MEQLAPEVRRAPPGVDEPYDTLDDIILADSTVEELYERLYSGLQGTVGIAVGGQNTLSSPNDGYWGRALTLSTGEHLQMRILPRGSFGRPLDHSDFRLVATRRSSHLAVPEVGFAIFYMPRDAYSIEGTTPLTCGSTIGCRGVHVILPSLFSKHDAHRARGTGGASMDPHGFHSVRPSSVHLPMSTGGGKRGNGSFALTAGDSYLVFAGQMAGVDIPDPLRRCSEIMNHGDHSRHIVSKQRRMIQHIGEEDTHAYIFSALTLCELISAEGFLGIMCNQFFHGAMPDMFFSPVGIPLCLCMAIHVAAHPERFGLNQCTKADTYVNKEVLHAFHSRWDRLLLNGFRALDIAVKSGYDRAFAQAQLTKGLEVQIIDSLTLWQRIGQRLICKVMSDPRDEIRRPTAEQFATRFGKAELLADSITDAKYDAMAKKGNCCSVNETPIDKIFLAPRCDLRTTMYRMLDSSEAWLRTGMFGEIRINQENINVAQVETTRKRSLPCSVCGSCYTCACNADADKSTGGSSSYPSSSSSEESDDADDLMDNKICVSAMETAAGALAIGILHGPFSMHQFGIKSFLLGKGCKNKCADCDDEVEACQALLFGSKTSECPHCNHKRCFKCSTNALRPQHLKKSHCLRCDPAAPRMTKLLPSSPKHKKSAKK